MGIFELSIERKDLRYKLLVIEALVFVLPFLVLFYFFYENKILLNVQQLSLFASILDIPAAVAHSS